MNTTSYELRYLQQNWPRFQNIVRFYSNGVKVASCHGANNALARHRRGSDSAHR